MAENITIVLRANAEQAVKAFDEASRAFTGAADRMSAVGQRLTFGVTLPLAAIGAGALRAAAQWDTAMTSVAKTVDAPAAEIKRLGTEFVALSEQIPVASNELASIGAQAGQLGIATENILGFAKVVAVLGVSTNLTTEAAGNALARLSNIMGTSQHDFDRMGSAIVDLGNNLATTEAEIVEFGLRIAGAGKIAGLAESDVLAIGAALSSVGVQAEAGGTAVQKALIEMNTAVATNSAALQTFADVAGVTTEQFAKQWREKPIEGFRAFIEGLRREGDNAVPTIEELFDRNERLIRSFLSLANAGDLLQRSVKLSSEAWAENTALADEASKFYERLAADFERVANKAKNVAAELGTALAPQARTAAAAAGGLLDVARGAIQVFTSLPRPVQTLVVTVTALTAAAGPAALAISGLARAWGLWAGARAFLATPLTITAAKAALTGMSLVLSPGGALLIGLGLLAAAFARADQVARDATDSWRALLERAQQSVVGLNSSQTLELFVGAKQQKERAEAQLAAAQAELDRIKKEFAERRTQTMPSQLGNLRREENAATVELRAQIDMLNSVLPELRAKVAVLGPEFQRLQTEEFAAAKAAADLNASLNKVVVSGGAAVVLKFTELAEIQDDLKKKIEGARKEMFTLSATQATLASGSEAWNDLGESIASARTEIEQAEAALRAVNTQLRQMTQAKLSNLDFSKLAVPGMMPGVPFRQLPVPHIPTEQRDGRQVPVTLAPSATLQLQEALAARRQQEGASAFGLTVEQFEALEKAAMAAGVSTQEYASALGLVTKNQVEWQSVAITGIGAVTAAFASGMSNMKVTVTQAFTQILQGLSQKGGPLGGLFGGFGVAAFGAIGGVVAGLLSRKDRTPKVEIDRFSQQALQQQKQIQPPPQKVDIILVDSRGNQISRTAAELKRLETLDGVTRIPGYSPVGG